MTSLQSSRLDERLRTKALRSELAYRRPLHLPTRSRKERLAEQSTGTPAGQVSSRSLLKRCRNQVDTWRKFGGPAKLRCRLPPIYWRPCLGSLQAAVVPAGQADQLASRGVETTSTPGGSWVDLPSLRSSLPPMLRILLVKADKQSKLEPCLPVT